MLKNMSERHQIMKRLCAQGRTSREIATQLGMNQQTVRLIRRSPLFQAALKDHRASIDEKVAERVADQLVKGDPVREAFEKAKLPAAQKVIALMHEANSEKLQSENAWEILNCTGYKPREGGSGAPPTVVITGSQVMLLQETLNECTQTK